MDAADAIGFAGVAIILVAFALNTMGRLSSRSPAYLGMNAVGASLACASSVMVGFVPFVILEGVWALVALGGLVALGAAQLRNTS